LRGAVFFVRAAAGFRYNIAMEYFISACVGLGIGSFLNVCIHRMPREQSVVKPRSRCPACGAQIRWYDNIPLLSFALLRAKCRDCKAPISWRYPLVEAICGAATVTFMHRHMSSPPWLAVSLVAVYAIIALSFIDIDEMIIPDELSLGMAALGLVFFWANPNFHGAVWQKFLQSLGGAACGFGLMWAIAAAGEMIFKKEAMGGGDIKLMAGLGALLGWQGVFSTLMIGSFLGALWGLALLLSKRLGREQPIPFGPFLGLAGIVNLYSLVPLSAFIIGANG